MGGIDNIKKTLLPKDDFERSIQKYNLSRNPFLWGSICRAPSVNMYIGHHGVVRACCYNAIHPLGVWPHKTLMEIWESDKANELRDALNNYDLSKGCNICLQQFMAHNFEAFKAKQFDGSHQNKNKFPSSIEFELDNKCNLACVMCSEDFSSVIANNKGLKKYETPYNEEFIEQLIPFLKHLKQAKFYGGEPFMIKVYYQIWSLLSDLNPNCEIDIQTNATIYNQRVQELLEKNKNINLSVSIDSLQKENYESIRVGADFDVVMENTKVFHQYALKNNKFFGISACMMKSTFQEAPDFINYCNQLNIPIYFHTVVHPVHESIQNMPLEDIIYIYKRLKSIKFPEENQVQKKNSIHYKDFVKQIEFWIEQKEHGKSNEILKPVQNWDDFFQRVRTACVSVYGVKMGLMKAKKFETTLKDIIKTGYVKDESIVFDKIVHEDLSSTIHRVVDLNEQEMIDSLQRLDINTPKTK
ncbi:MAG: radical SAM protein [Chitinophagales bacterium]|nr:radical SAM protein [Chitinophagales bacterium]